jgi:hypothetical protein
LTRRSILGLEMSASSVELRGCEAWSWAGLHVVLMIVKAVRLYPCFSTVGENHSLAHSYRRRLKAQLDLRRSSVYQLRGTSYLIRIDSELLSWSARPHPLSDQPTRADST